LIIIDTGMYIDYIMNFGL